MQLYSYHDSFIACHISLVLIYVCVFCFRLGALFFVTVIMGMVNIPAIEVFMQERPIFM